MWADSQNKAVQAIQAAVIENKASAELTTNNGYHSDQVYFNMDHVPAVTTFLGHYKRFSTRILSSYVFFLKKLNIADE